MFIPSVYHHTAPQCGDDAPSVNLLQFSVSLRESLAANKFTRITASINVCRWTEFYAYKENENIFGYTATWQMVTLPGTCGICLAHNATRLGGELKDLFDKVRIEIARLDGYGLLMYADIGHFNKVSESNGWRTVDQFRNPRTGNNVEILTVKL